MAKYRVVTDQGAYMVTTEDPQSVPSAVKEALVGSAKSMGDMATLRNEGPVNMAKALPQLAGAAGAVLPIPFGNTAGTVGGRQISNLALRSIGREEEIPSTARQVGEGALAVLGDASVFPAINKARIGREIGAVEKAAGVPEVQNIPSLPRPKVGEPVAGGIDETIKSVSDAKASGGAIPTYWKQIKDQIDHFYNLGKDQKLTALERGKLRWLNSQVQEGLNSSVPGRAPLAADFARSQAVPNMIRDTALSLPPSVRTGLGIGTGSTVVPAVGYALWKALGGSGR